MSAAAVREVARPSDVCQVCGTSANVRKNFGVPSCVSCRIFYSRNTGKELVCYQNGNCRIEGPSRKSCAACRFQKCMRAGMQKSRERKYKPKKPPAGDLQAPVAKSHAKFASADALEAPKKAESGGLGPLLLMQQKAELSEADRNLFVHFYKMAEMFRLPYETDAGGLLAKGVRDTYSGLCLLEAITKRTLAIIRFLPHFSQLERGSVSALVSEKISGLFTILRTLHYQPDSGLMQLPVTDGVQQQQVQQPLEQVVTGLFSDLVAGEQALMTDQELKAIVVGLSKLFADCHRLFKDRANVGVILLLGIYFFLPDFKTVEVDEEQMRTYQSLYLNCLQELLQMSGASPQEAMDGYNRALFLVAEVKHVDFYCSMLSRRVRMQPKALRP